MYYYEVSPSTLVRKDASSFTYSYASKLAIGTVCQIPVGKKTLTGVIVEQVDQPEYSVKPIESLVSTSPIPAELVATAVWMSQYYATHLSAVWQTVLPRGVTKKRRKTATSPLENRRDRTKNVFTADQLKALQSIDDMSPGTALLHGVTGSGKTLVYIEAIKKTLADGKSAIVLVPEIALTSQLVAEFKNHFSSILLTHSSQTESERHAVWNAALQATTPTVVIGPRSALFLPLSSVGFIVIDECHEPSFKQEQSPRYSALRVAGQLAVNHSAKLLLGSATPLIGDYYLANQLGRPIMTMSKPAQTGTIKPDVKIVDMTKRGNFNSHYFLSDQLLSALKDSFDKNQQALIFHNRRGSASSTLCENCGWNAGCPRCFIPLTLHADQHHLSCHICASTMTVPTSCPECQNADIIHRGIGTKRIETELRKLFPNQSIARFDGDTESSQTVDQRYQELYDGSIDLIIGTQVVAKGLDLPKLRTVGIVQADAGLSLPDFSSSERTFQLLAQVVGRVGRSHHPTNVILQSYQPNHPAVVDGVSQNYKDFYERTISQRRHTNFPPFTHLLKLTCVYKTEAAAIRNARALQQDLRQHFASEVEILGPTPSFYERVRDTYRWQLVLKSHDRNKLIEAVSLLPAKQWQFELDPQSLL